MRCDELMKRQVECVSAEDPAQLAAQKMRDENIGFLPVCDHSNKVIGTITDRDLTTRLLADDRPAKTKLGDVMTREVVACRPEDDLQRAEELMSRHHKSRMICVDGGGRLMGIISLSDIAQKEDAGRAAQTMRAVSEREARP
jgi:CBS domain-containing protein